MQYFLRLIQGDCSILLEFKGQASRGATIAGLHNVSDQVVIKAWDEDEQGRIWEKEI